MAKNKEVVQAPLLNDRFNAKAFHELLLEAQSTGSYTTESVIIALENYRYHHQNPEELRSALEQIRDEADKMLKAIFNA